MMTPFAEFHFLRPLCLLLLLAIPLFWLLRHRTRAQAGAWRGAIDAHLLPHLIERIDAGSGRAGIALATLLWSLACVALAGPTWEREPMPLYRNQAARVLALELSSTMLAQDEKPTRFERARYKLVDILERSKDYQTALIGYAGEAYVAAPLTDDIGTVRNLVDALDPSTMPVAGNRAAAAISAAQELIRQAGLHRGDIILLADSADQSAVEAARKAHAAGLVVSVLGVGSAAGAPVALAQGDFLKDDRGNVIVARRDDASLAAVAEAGGGHYATLTADARDIDSLLVERTAASASEADASGELAESTRWRDRGPWIVLLLVPLAALAFRRGWLMAIALALLLPAPRADAASFKDLWLRSDQQAAAALAQGDAKTAAGVARSPDWHGSASFRAGDYASAATDYAEVSNADGAYNEGNALAKLGRYEDALAAYDRALKLAPDMDDAKANKAAVEDWLKQKQKQKQDKSSRKQQSKSGSSKDKQSSGGKSQQDQDQQDQDKQNESGGQNQDQDSQQQGDSKSQQDDGEKERQSDSGQKSGGDQDKQQSSAGTDGSTSEAQSQAEPSEGKPSSAQQQALSKAIDQSLARGGSGKPDKTAKAAAAAEDDDATQEKRQALDHLLQRVPDDPGGLLRRKFLLEHQRRMQRGDGEG